MAREPADHLDDEAAERRDRQRDRARPPDGQGTDAVGDRRSENRTPPATTKMRRDPARQLLGAAPVDQQRKMRAMLLDRAERKYHDGAGITRKPCGSGRGQLAETNQPDRPSTRETASRRSRRMESAGERPIGQTSVQLPWPWHRASASSLRSTRQRGSRAASRWSSSRVSARLSAAGPGNRSLCPTIVHAETHIPQPMHSIARAISRRSAEGPATRAYGSASARGVRAAPTSRSLAANGVMSTTRSRSRGKW